GRGDRRLLRRNHPLVAGHHPSARRGPGRQPPARAPQRASARPPRLCARLVDTRPMSRLPAVSVCSCDFMTSTGGLTSRPPRNTGRGLSAMPRNAPPGVHALSPGPRRRTSRPADIYLAGALIATGVYAGLLIVRFTTSDPLFGVRDLGI